MMRRSFLVVLVVLCAGLALAAPLAAQNTFQPFDREVEDLRYLYSRARLSLPETSFPVSRRDLQRRALELLESPRAAALDEEIEHYLDRLAYNERDITVDVTLDFFLEAHTYDIDIENYDDFSEKVRDHDPFAVLAMGYSHDAVGSLFIRGDAIAEYSKGGYTNYPPYREGRPFGAEYNFVREGYIQYFFGPLETVFGRQKVHIGPAPTTSLYVSHEVPFLDALRVKLPFGPLTMTMIWATMENRRTLEEQQALDEDTLSGPVPGVGDRELYDWQQNIILTSIQRFEWDFGRLRGGIGARTIMVREMNEFHFGDLFPVFSRHNANIVPNNMSLVADLSFAAAPGLDTYLLFGFDDMDAGLIGYADDALPTIGAYVAGAVYRNRFPGLRFTGDFEIGTTHDLWGNFEDKERLARAIYRMDLVGPNRAMPLTSPYGPGVVWVTAAGRAEFESGLSAGLRLLLRNRNSEVDLYTTPYDGSSRDADRETSFQADIDLRYQFGERSYATLSPTLLIDSDGAEARLSVGFGSGIGGRSTVGSYSP